MNINRGLEGEHQVDGDRVGAVGRAGDVDRVEGRDEGPVDGCRFAVTAARGEHNGDEGSEARRDHRREGARVPRGRTGRVRCALRDSLERMAYTLRTLPGADPLALHGLAPSTTAIVRGALGGYQRDAWEALWGPGSRLADDPSGAVVLRYVSAAERSHLPWPPPPPLTTPPVDTVKVLSPVPVSFATMESGLLVARAADGTRILNFAPTPEQLGDEAYVRLDGRVVYQGQGALPLGSLVVRSGVSLATATLAHAPFSAVVAAADGTTFDGHAVWRQFSVASDGAVTLPLSGGAILPTTTPAVTLDDVDPRWVDNVAIPAVSRGDTVTLSVIAVAADGTLWLGSGALEFATAITSTVTTFGAFAPGAGLVAVCPGGNGARVGASWRLVMV